MAKALMIEFVSKLSIVFNNGTISQLRSLVAYRSKSYMVNNGRITDDRIHLKVEYYVQQW